MKTLTQALLAAKTLDDVKELVNKYFTGDNSIEFAHSMKNQDIDIYGNYSERKTFNENLIALISHKYVKFFFGEISNKDSCQNQIVATNNEDGELISYILINVGTSKKTKYLGYNHPSLGFLGHYLNDFIIE